MAEVFSPHPAGQRKCAFTLAEVLITLGIIGVVAAMTLPTLIGNYQKQLYVAQLKKSVSTLEQAFRLALADAETDNLENTSLFSQIGSDECNLTHSPDGAVCANFYSGLKKYLKVISIAQDKNYKYTYIKKGSTAVYPSNSANTYFITLPDGTFLHSFRFYKDSVNSTYTCDNIKSLGGNMCAMQAFLKVDVNGNKGPNIEGRDIFNFNVSSDGRLVAFWSKSSVIYSEGSDNNAWYNNASACGTKGKADASEKATYGSGCAARIIDNGWVMDY